MAVYSQNSVYLPVFSRNDIPGVNDCELLQPLFKRKKIYGDYRRDVYHIICFILSGTIGNGCKYRLC